MAERLIVENFGPLKKIDIDLSRVMIFIGPQSVGKSTIAKLVAIFRSIEFVFTEKRFRKALNDYGISSFLQKTSFINYESLAYKFSYKKEKEKKVFNETHEIYGLINELEEYERRNLFYSFYVRQKNESTFLEIKEEFEKTEKTLKQAITTKKGEQPENNEEKTYEKRFKELEAEVAELKKEKNMFLDKYTNHLEKHNRIARALFKYISFSSYMPSERSLISVVSDSIMSLVHYDIPIPKTLSNFASIFENAKSKLSGIHFSFLNLTFKFIENENRLYLSDNNYFKLSDASSGLQSIIPLLLVLNFISSDKKVSNAFVIEEPELNLYPKNQYELSKILANICFDKYEFTDKHNELIITTHSPYILAAFNNFLLAHKIGTESRDEVSNVIPQKSWVDPEHFKAYYIDENGIENIFDKETGLIAENHLDQTSEIIMDDFNELMDLYSTKVH